MTLSFTGDAAPSAASRVGVSNVHDQESVWRLLTSFCIYRLVIVVVLALVLTIFNAQQILGGSAPTIALTSLAVYFIVAVGLLLIALARTVEARWHPTMNVVVDVIFLTTLMHSSGGVRSGWGLLLLATLAAAGLVSRGRMAYFHAALAAIAVLIEQSWQLLVNDGAAADYVQTGLLAGSYFAIAGLGYTLAKYARGAEEIAAARGVDLANLAQINALVIRDIQDGFVVVDESDIIRQFNPQSTALVARLEHCAGRSIVEVAPEIGRALNEWRDNPQRIFPLMRDTTSGRDYQLRFVAVGTAATLVFLEDASRIRDQAQQMKLVALGRLTASIAHEIRNPLSSINHAAELLQEDVQRNDADQRLLTIIRDNAHRLDRMVQEVLYLNRRDRAHPEAIDMHNYLPEFARQFCSTEKQPPELIALHMFSHARAIFDRSHLDQVLWNLTRNARRHGTGSAGSIEISYAATADGMRIEVRDDGPGVATEAIAHLFEPFFTTDADGTGLGLYIARELAEVNGARIDFVAPQTAFVIESKSPATQAQGGSGWPGACFRVTMRGNS